ncbi:hypothetical protein L207DRAFT_584285 [Hyaloscypha variabilis F]|uniref:Velvet domain-containing protein n=1 Tax=Hyaloscypha variabilis (strain UAMH 11265 / GT02V1 / F) TaxID=1149755 RepID=A0A2J6RK28_HYAVF|nr:hypothetical protein L207DRAFT_584285 [Hyaloscypha variabilis F]
MAAPPPPSTASVSRVTKKGRKLTYCLTVIQQPERARACGSGAKSSADRRPVDPPPVVELRIFQGEGKEQEDITFSYNANFFLFATLEVARVIAPHRGLPQPPSPQVPVLTGMPVSGMAYLDRPTEAGYFIFPDLSVRHEGKYRLSFNLYEETKEDGDKDGEAGSMSDSKPKISAAASAPDSSFDWRLEVKSAQFTVFSAKKFPGLAESTTLSRTVAEQGCRVRIRRDVRMRRREGKSGGDYDDVAEDEYARPGRAAEQSHDPFRERSHSGSPDGRGQYPDHQRRQSAEYQQPYPQYTPSPLQGHAPPPPGGHLGFLGGRDSGPLPFGAPPQPHFAPPPPPPPPQAAQNYQPAQNAYPPPSSAQFRGPPPPPPQTNLPYEGRQYPQSAHPTNPPREQRENFDEYRRASAPYPSAQAPTGSQFPAVDPGFNRPPYHSFARPQSPHTPATLPPLLHHDSLTSPPGPLSSVNRIAPPLRSPNYERAPERSNSYSHVPTALPPLGEPTRNGKRSFDDVFSAASAASTQPLYNGMRPSSSHNQAQDDEEDTVDLRMNYKRADGSNYVRELPALE